MLLKMGQGIKEAWDFTETEQIFILFICLQGSILREDFESL